jgi:hypothetical protein
MLRHAVSLRPSNPKGLIICRAAGAALQCGMERHNPRPVKITFGEMRAAGVVGILVYCADYKCSYSIAMAADRWADEVRLSDIEPRFVCNACGKRGADVRPHFAPARMGSFSAKPPRKLRLV